MQEWHLQVACGGAGDAAPFVRRWELQRAARHVFFASDRLRDKDAVREGEEILPPYVHRGDNAGLYDVVKHDAWRRFTRAVAAAGVGTGAEEKQSVSDFLRRFLDSSKDWEYNREDESEGAMQDQFRSVLTHHCDFMHDNVGAELGQCAFAALPVVRAGGDPVFAVEAAGRDEWAVTSYFPGPLRHTAFAGVPVRVAAASGLWYEVCVRVAGAPVLRVVA